LYVYVYLCLYTYARQNNPALWFPQNLKLFGPRNKCTPTFVYTYVNMYAHTNIRMLTYIHTRVYISINISTTNGICKYMHSSIYTFILQGWLIAPFLSGGLVSIQRFCFYSALLVRIPRLFCVRGKFRSFIERKLSNLSALLVLSPVNM